MIGLRTQNLNSACDLVRDFNNHDILKKDFEFGDRGNYLSQGYELLSGLNSFKKNTPILKLKRDYTLTPISLRQ